MFVAIIYWIDFPTNIKMNINSRLERELNLLTSVIDSNVHNNANALNYVHAHFKTEGVPDTATFRKLVKGIESQHPDSTPGIGFISLVKKNDLSKFIQTHHDFPAENLPHLYPEKELFTRFMMVEPLSETRVKPLGIDMLDESARRLAIINAIKKSGITVSNSVLPLVCRNPIPFGSIILLLPYYDTFEVPLTAELRLAHARGLIYIPLYLRDFFNNALGKNSINNERVNFTLAYIDPVTSEEKIIYQRFEMKMDNETITRSQIMDLYGQKWKVTIYTLPEFLTFADRYLANVSIAGLFL